MKSPMAVALGVRRLGAAGEKVDSYPGHTDCYPSEAALDFAVSSKVHDDLLEAGLHVPSSRQPFGMTKASPG